MEGLEHELAQDKLLLSDLEVLSIGPNTITTRENLERRLDKSLLAAFETIEELKLEAETDQDFARLDQLIDIHRQFLL
ncbi:hypothetical protein HDU83_002142 [Entophlyctis luteolus]|nr:hypothetical protein HDU83_002142 [Entophlyctis luteolus]